jgi:hypothetical protein
MKANHFCLKKVRKGVREILPFQEASLLSAIPSNIFDFSEKISIFYYKCCRLTPGVSAC